MSTHDAKHARSPLGFIKHELRELLPPTIFFFLAFHLLALSRALMLKQYGVTMSAVAGATIGALVVGKVVLIADAIPIINRFPNRPLIYNIVWKTTIYVLAALVVHYLEHLIPIWWKSGSLADANRTLLGEIVWAHFWAVQLWLLVLLLMYCTLRELVRALGREEVMRMFFGAGEGIPPHR